MKQKPNIAFWFLYYHQVEEGTPSMTLCPHTPQPSWKLVTEYSAALSSPVLRWTETQKCPATALLKEGKKNVYGIFFLELCHAQTQEGSEKSYLKKPVQFYVTPIFLHMFEMES